MTFLPRTVGAGLLEQTSLRATLGASNHGGVTVRITSSNPTVVLVSPDTTTPGTASIDVVVPNGQTLAFYRMQGVEGTTGSATITGSALNFTDGTGTGNVVQPALRLIGLSTSTTALSPDDPFQVEVGIPNVSNTTLSVAQVVRPGGAAFTATLTNSQATVGQLGTTATTGQSVTVPIAVGQNRSPSTVATGGVAFDPQAAGSTVVSATIPGFIATIAGTVTVNVSP